VCVCILKTLARSVLVSDAINAYLKTERPCALSLLFTFPIARGFSFEIYIATIKTTVSARIDVTPNVCVGMDVNDGPVSSSSENEDSLQTQPPTPPLSDASNDTTPPAKPPRSADIPPDPAPRPSEWVWPYQEGLSLASTRQHAIQHWNLPNIPNTGRKPDAPAPSTKALHDGIPKVNPLCDLWRQPGSITMVG